MMKRLSSVCFLGMIFVSGCATVPRTMQNASPALDVPKLIQHEKAGDARFLEVRGREYLVFDTDSKAKLDDYKNQTGAEPKREFIQTSLTLAKSLGDEATTLCLKRVETAKIAEFLGSRASGSLSPYDQLLSLYKEDAAQKLDEEKARVSQMAREADLDGYYKTLRSRIEPSIKTRGRTGRQLLLLPLSPFVNLWMGLHILTTPHSADQPKSAMEKVEIFRPSHADPARFPNPADAELLKRFAPAIAVEKNEDAKYDPNSDRFGHIRMEGESAVKAQPKVDVSRPTVFGYAETKTIQGSEVKRLVYTLWFPERPQMGGGFDPEVGSTQGAIIRITLNRANQPVVYENVSSCGCYFKIFPSEALEQAAAAQYHAPLAGKHWVLENKVSGKIDADLPALVAAGPDTTAFFSAGKHEVMDIRPGVPQNTKIVKEQTYELVPYEDLENLPFHGASISLFDENGLVRNADRAESTLLAASGMYHAGTPRQRGTLMIYFDQADFDDSHLLETYLRLPEHAFEAQS